MKMNKYCYCIIMRENQDALILDDLELNVIQYKDIAMVTEDTEEEEVFPTGDRILNHEQTIENIMKNMSVIPMSLGNICKTQKEIRNFLKNNYDKLKKIFTKIQNRIEVGLKIYWTAESFSDEIEDSNIKALKNEIQNDKKSSNLRVSKVGRLVEEKVDKKRAFYMDQIFKKLSQYAYDSKSNICHTPRMVINSSFLIDRNKEDEFDNHVNALHEKYKDSLVFKYTGPWPPYNFIEGNFDVR